MITSPLRLFCGTGNDLFLPAALISAKLLSVALLNTPLYYLYMRHRLKFGKIGTAGENGKSQKIQ